MLFFSIIRVGVAQKQGEQERGGEEVYSRQLFFESNAHSITLYT